MNNKIKVWVAVDLRLFPQSVSSDEMDAKVQACRRFNTNWNDLEKYGWSIRRATLKLEKRP